MLGLMLAGESHFSYAQKPGANLIAMFVEKAAQARIPQGVTAVGGPVTLNIIDPLRGFASDTNQVLEVPAIDSVPNIIAQGIPYYWYFDREMATAWRNYVEANVGKPHVMTRQNGVCGNVEVSQNQPIYNDTIQVADNFFPADAREQRVRNISGNAAGFAGRKYVFKASSFFETNLIWGIVELPATATQKVSQKPIRYKLVPNTGGADQVLTIICPTRVAAGQDFIIEATSSAGVPVETEIYASSKITQNGNTYRVNSRPNWKADTGIVKVRFTQRGGAFLRTKFEERIVKVYNYITSTTPIVGGTIGLRIAPNPTSGTFNIYADSPILGSVVVLDLLGNRVLTLAGLGSGSLLNIDASHLKPGLYFVRSGNSLARLVRQ